MDWLVLLIFLLVYLGMFLGEFPGLALDRTGVALLGAIALIVAQRVTPAAAWQAVDVPTIGLLFALMVVSAQFRLGGFYTWVAQRLGALHVGPLKLLAIWIAAVGVLSAVLGNDIICLAMTPVLIDACTRRRLDPLPFLLALAMASNVGSAATLIGNPQNILIGESLNLPFAGYLLDAGVPALLGLGVVWAVIGWTYRGRWERDAAPLPFAATTAPARWQTAKGLLLTVALMAAFLAGPWPRDVLALIAAGLLLLSRKMATRDMLALVDWHLLVLFIGLFVVNHALAASGWLRAATDGLRQAGVDLHSPAWLMLVTVVLSNLVSNVPAVMLLLPEATHSLAGPTLALASTLAGNLLIVGSIANIIVVEQAARLDVRISLRQYARVGVPVTLLTLALAAGWLALRAL